MGYEYILNFLISKFLQLLLLYAYTNSLQAKKQNKMIWKINSSLFPEHLDRNSVAKQNNL